MSELERFLPSYGHLYPPLCMHSSLTRRSPPRDCHHVEHHSMRPGIDTKQQHPCKDLVPNFDIIKKDSV